MADGFGSFEGPKPNLGLGGGEGWGTNPWFGAWGYDPEMMERMRREMQQQALATQMSGTATGQIPTPESAAAQRLISSGAASFRDPAAPQATPQAPLATPAAVPPTAPAAAPPTGVPGAQQYGPVDPAAKAAGLSFADRARNWMARNMGGAGGQQGMNALGAMGGQMSRAAAPPPAAPPPQAPAFSGRGGQTTPISQLIKPGPQQQAIAAALRRRQQMGGGLLSG